jgi:hypothetical protein
MTLRKATNKEKWRKASCASPRDPKDKLRHKLHRSTPPELTRHQARDVLRPGTSLYSHLASSNHLLKDCRTEDERIPDMT